MVAIRLTFGGFQSPATLDTEAIRKLFDPCAEPGQLTSQAPDPIAFLDSQLGRVTDLGHAAREQAQDGDKGKLVDGAWYQVAPDRDPSQAAAACPQVGPRLAGHLALAHHLHLAAHLAQDVEE